jgi:hypothetical protein
MNIYLSSSDLEAQCTKRPNLNDDLSVKADGNIDILNPGFDIPMEQALPTEMIRSILDILVANEQSRALANAAQCNRRMYDYIIPKMYKTIRATKENRDKLVFGCTRKLVSSYITCKLMIQLPTDHHQDSLGKISP